MFATKAKKDDFRETDRTIHKKEGIENEREHCQAWRLAHKQVDQSSNSRTSAALQYRYGLLLVDLQRKNRRVHRILQGRN